MQLHSSLDIMLSAYALCLLQHSGNMFALYALLLCRKGEQNIHLQVDLSNINFRYPTRTDVVALEGVSLKLEPGKLVALVGLSGSGKSTLVALLQRLYDPNSGQVWGCIQETSQFGQKTSW